MKVLFFGDVVGELGMSALSDVLPSLREKTGACFVIVNGENASKGKGLTYKDAKALFEMGADCVTLGNHWHSKDQIDHYIGEFPGLLRPANLLHYYRGQGSRVFETSEGKIRVTSLLGQSFMEERVASPYETLNRILDEEEEDVVHFVDYHAESTSEKQTFAYGFDGSISALVGTHTHVQTNDAHILPNGTGYCSDAGMCGGFDTVIGAEPESAIDRFLLGQEEARLSFPSIGRKQVNAVLLDFDPLALNCKSIQTIFFVDGKEKR